MSSEKTPISTSHELTPEVKMLIPKLYEAGCMRFPSFPGEFTNTTTGRPILYLFDISAVTSEVDVRDAIVGQYIRAAASIMFDNVISDVPTSITAYVGSIATLGRYEILTVKKNPKPFDSSVAGFKERHRDKRVLLIDDAATTGGSILAVARVLREAGAVVRDALVLLDRLEGAREILEKYDIELHSIVAADDLLRGQIDQARFDKIMREAELQRKLAAS